MLADSIAFGLHRRVEEIELEQAVRGLDACDELMLHPIIAAGLTSSGYGVHREQRYPADHLKKRKSEGKRCDIVLTHGSTELALPVDPAQPDLFDDEKKRTRPEDAYWMEVKTVAQFIEGRGNRAWASAIQRPVWKDVEKLSQDPGIRHAGVLLVLFTLSREVADHDLGVWMDRAMDHDLHFHAPLMRRIPLKDRWGNTLCTCALFPLPRL